MICLREVPIGISTRPVLLTFPTREKIPVPLLFSVPIFAYQSAPLLMIKGTLAQVLTLFRLVGLFHSPRSTVWIYFALGSPILPSIDATRAEDSPHTNAPPPWFIVMSRSNPELNMFIPKNPYSLAWSIAIWRRFNARGYSARTYK